MPAGSPWRHYFRPEGSDKIRQFIVNLLANNNIRFRNFKKHEWTPKYPVLIGSMPLEVIMDSGADMSLINYQVGLDLGFTKLVGEFGESTIGVGGEVTYLIRTVAMSIEDKTFNARLAWLQSDPEVAP